jgi:dihydroorotase
MLSEDGRDITSDNLFLEAMKEAKRVNIPISCHCDLGGENNAVRRVIELGKKAGCHIHIAHVSTREAIEMIRKTRDELRRQGSDSGFSVTCEVMPHNLCLTEEDAEKLGKGSWGRVNPPLRSEEDRKALLRATADGTVDAIATDHAPHSGADKEKGAPGFSGFETAFAAAFTELVRGPEPKISLKLLSSLMSAGPARILGFGASEKKGRILPGCRADLIIVDPDAAWIVKPENQKTKGKNNPFAGRELFGKILMTIRNGRIVSTE